MLSKQCRLLYLKKKTCYLMLSLSLHVNKSFLVNTSRVFSSCWMCHLCCTLMTRQQEHGKRSERCTRAVAAKNTSMLWERERILSVHRDRKRLYVLFEILKYRPENVLQVVLHKKPTPVGYLELWMGLLREIFLILCDITNQIFWPDVYTNTFNLTFYSIENEKTGRV